jgi:hypothetical protein
MGSLLLKILLITNCFKVKKITTPVWLVNGVNKKILTNYHEGGSKLTSLSFSGKEDVSKLHSGDY